MSGDGGEWQKIEEFEAPRMYACMYLYKGGLKLASSDKTAHIATSRLRIIY